MFHRIIGLLLIVTGMSISAAGLVGWLRTDAMVRMFTEFSEAGALHGKAFEPDIWSLHWRVENFVVIAIGILTATAGVATALKKPFGYLAVFGIFAFAGTYPIVLHISGYARYSWEDGSAHGGLPYFAVALAALLAHLVTTRRRRTERT